MRYFYPLMVLLCTCFIGRANTIYTEWEQPQSIAIVDSVVCDIVIDGVSIPSFTPLDTVYDVTIPFNAPIPVAEFIFCDSSLVADTIIIDAAVALPGTSIYQISTVAGDVTYHINWWSETPSSDADLASLTSQIGTLCPPFSPEHLNYELAVGPSFTSLTQFTAILSDSLATLSISGSGTVAPYGDINILVTAEDNITTKLYTIHVVENCSPNFDLVFISDSNATWCEEFNGDQSIYYVVVDSSYYSFQILENVVAVDTLAEVYTYTTPEDPLRYARVGVENQDSVVFYEVYFVDTCPPLTVNEISLDQLEIYPNPVSDLLNIHVKSGNMDLIKLIDISGRMVQSINLQEGVEYYQVDLSDYTSGLYLIQVYQLGKLIQSEKLIKN